MRFDLPNARVRTGLQITDNSQDETLKYCLDYALSAAEQYCDRYFAWKVDEASFYYSTSNAFQLPRFPISRIRSITAATGQSVTAMQYEIDYGSGMVIFDRALYRRHLKITYEGGYQYMPANLLAALWALFDATYSAASGGVQAVTAGALDSVTLQGVGTVRFHNASSSSSASATPGGVLNLPPPHDQTLELFSRKVA